MKAEPGRKPKRVTVLYKEDPTHGFYVGLVWIEINL